MGRCGSGGSTDKEEDKRIGADRIYVPLWEDGVVGEVETSKKTREFAQTGFNRVGEVQKSKKSRELARTGFMFPCGKVWEWGSTDK